MNQFRPVRGLNNLIALLLLSLPVQAADKTVDWPSYGGDTHSSKYSPLSQISGQDTQRLEVAWQWQSADNPLVTQSPEITPWSFKSTPIAINGVLYVSTSLNQVAAINGATGKQLWVFDTKTWERGRPTNLGFNHRGVAYWSDNRIRRILMPTNDGRLFSLDADTGKPDPEFGIKGVVDLTQGLGRTINRSLYSVISAPMVVGNTVIVGSSIMDAPTHKEMPPGHIRGFDVRTGSQRWRFNTIPQAKEFGADSWEDEAWAYSGNTNMWTLASAYLELGYVYLPIGTPTNDWYGGHRLGNNLFGETLLCVEADTGRRVWHYQFVHHGLWDYDLPAAPNLLDIKVNGKTIKAVAQPTKQGFLFVFDRENGKPVWPIEERAVAKSDIPGERTSPTQPFPSHPEPFVPQGFSVNRLINFSPELRKAALDIVKPLRMGPLYTPPSLQGTVQLPGWAGGANWWGAAVDPETQALFLPAVNSPIVVKLTKPKAEESNFDFVRSRGVNSLRGPEGLPINKPPYSTVTAYNMNTGNKIWVQPLGNGPRKALIAAGIADPGPLGGGRGAGPLLTKTALFMAFTDEKRPRLAGIDKATGQVLGEVTLPAEPSGTPMTYAIDGVQYIALALGQANAASLIALRLPKSQPKPKPKPNSSSDSKTEL